MLSGERGGGDPEGGDGGVVVQVPSSIFQDDEDDEDEEDDEDDEHGDGVLGGCAAELALEP